MAEFIDRMTRDKNILEKFLLDFAKVIEKQGVKYIVVSGFVAIAHGRIRGTEDIDMIIERIGKKRFVELHNDLVKAGFECMQSDDAELIFDNYLNCNLSVRYTKRGEYIPEMELKLAKDELDEMQINEREKIDFTGLDVWFSSIEINIAFKEELLKSEKDIEDARHLRLIYKNKLDENKINKIKKMIRELRLKEKR